jgi:hypothetical protein
MVIQMTSEEPSVRGDSMDALVEEKRGRSEEIRRWLTIGATIALIVFLIYLLLILVYPSMNIGTNP